MLTIVIMSTIIGTAVCGASGHQLTSSGVRLAVEQGISLAWRSETVWSQRSPIAVELVDADGTAAWLQGDYESVRAGNSSLICKGTIQSPNGTRFIFDDTFRIHEDQPAFTLTRRVTIEHPSPSDTAFSTRFALDRPGGLDAYDILAPGVWYGRNANVGRHAIGGDYSDTRFYFREDRLAAPFVMAMDRESGITLSIGHASPNAHTFKEEDFLPRLVDERMQFGSLGLERLDGGISAGFLYPGSEGEKTYIEGGSASRRWALRSHPVREGVEHSYTLVLRLGGHSSYPEAVRDTWRFFYDLYDPAVVRADLKKVYADGVDLLARYARFRNGAPGFPFSIGMDGEAGMYTYQMGFVGAQIPCACHLVRSGILDRRSGRTVMGERIIDFWVRESYDGRTGADALPHTWYQPSMPPDAGPGPHWGVTKTDRFWRDEPQNGQVFLRTLSEGHLGALRAWEFAHRHGIEHDAWLKWARRYGDWLVRHQNDDGSYFRKYDVGGRPLQEVKDNTTHPIRFLCELHRVTGERSYLAAAVSAGEYALENSYRTASYVGGTPDNPNVTDKEAAQIALDAFLALYDSTRDRRWMDAAKQAADFVETWVYVWDVPMPIGDTDVAVFDKINTAGLSLVATGHSYADYADASSAYHFRRLYEITGDRHYRDMSDLLFHNTKQLLDTDCSKGYAHPGLQVEGIGLSLLRGRGAQVWLPWVTLAHIDPIACMEDEPLKPPDNKRAIEWSRKSWAGAGFKCPLELANGDILAARTMGAEGGGVSIFAYRSTDGGRTWSRFGEIVHSDEPGIDIGDGHLMQMRNGHVLHSYRRNVTHGVKPEDRTYRLEVAISRDNGATWQPHSEVARASGDFRGLWSTFLLEKIDGRLQCYYDDEDTPSRNGFHRHQWLTMKIWDAKSKRWTDPVTVSRAHNPQHLSRDGMCSVVELSKNKLLCAFETVQTYPPHRGVLMYVTSDDGGRTWSWQKQERGLLYQPPDPDFNALASWMIQLSTGDLLCVLTTDEDREKPGVAATAVMDQSLKYIISRDGGKTWSRSATIDSDHPIYFPGVCELRHGSRRGTILVQYNGRRGHRLKYGHLPDSRP